MYLLEHLDYRLVCPSVEWPPEGANAGGDRGVEIDPGASHMPYRRGGTVLLVIGMENQEHLKGPHHIRIDNIRTDGRVEHHIQEIRGISQLVRGIDHPMAAGDLVRHGGECPEL
ncbi:hypothetical protein ES708_34078 [subsurface metagenome]